MIEYVGIRLDERIHLIENIRALPDTRLLSNAAIASNRPRYQPPPPPRRPRSAATAARWNRPARQGNAAEIRPDIALASYLWKAAPAEQKQRLQRVLFPQGVTYSEGKYGTAVTCLLFSGMGTKGVKKEGLVALPGIEPGF